MSSARVLCLRMQTQSTSEEASTGLEEISELLEKKPVNTVNR